MLAGNVLIRGAFIRDCYFRRVSALWRVKFSDTVNSVCDDRFRCERFLVGRDGVIERNYPFRVEGRVGLGLVVR